MKFSLREFNQLTSVEEYLSFFQIPYEQGFVNVNRLHILKIFSQNLAKIDADNANLPEAEILHKYREGLRQAYETFLSKKPLETKLFKVFHHKPNNIVMVREIQT